MYVINGQQIIVLYIQHIKTNKSLHIFVIDEEGGIRVGQY